LVRFDWSTLDDTEFEELCKECMRRKGFRNVVRMSGPGSGDRGRDLHAEESLFSQTGRSIDTKILVQCKNYWGSRTTIGPSTVEKLAQRARTLGYNRVLIITSYDLSAQAKQTALDINKNPALGVSVDWWTEYDLSGLLLEYPDVKQRFSFNLIAPPVMNIGILNGYALNPSREKPATSEYARVAPSYWDKLLKNKNIATSLIQAAEIETRFDAIINPLGEAYPEENPQSRGTYQRIKAYIHRGGLFVNTAGFPFFYYWDPVEGQKHVATEFSKALIDVQKQKVTQYFSWSETALYQDFGVSLDAGSPREVSIFQTDKEKQYVGDLLAIGINKIIQFRAVTPPGPAIPLLQAEEGKLYPLAAVRYGDGHLLIAGFDLYEREAPLIANTVKNWLITAGGQLPLRQ
jgi:hypothetical protein